MRSTSRVHCFLRGAIDINLEAIGRRSLWGPCEGNGREESREFNNESLERFRDYLKLLAHSQLDSLLARQIDASDVAQQTMLNAMANVDQFRGQSEADFLAWLRQILANSLIDAYRYHRRAKRNVARNHSLDESIFESFQRVEMFAQSCSTPSQCANQERAAFAAFPKRWTPLPTLSERLSCSTTCRD